MSTDSEDIFKSESAKPKPGDSNPSPNESNPEDTFKPEDALTSAAAKNEGLQMEAITNELFKRYDLNNELNERNKPGESNAFSRSNENNEQSEDDGQDETKNAIRKEVLKKVGAAVAMYFGLPPELGEKAGEMAADKMEEDEKKQAEEKKGQQKGFRPSSMGIGG